MPISTSGVRICSCWRRAWPRGSSRIDIVHVPPQIDDSVGSDHAPMSRSLNHRNDHACFFSDTLHAEFGPGRSATDRLLPIHRKWRMRFGRMRLEGSRSMKSNLPWILPARTNQTRASSYRPLHHQVLRRAGQKRDSRTCHWPTCHR